MTDTTSGTQLSPANSLRHLFTVAPISELSLATRWVTSLFQ